MYKFIYTYIANFEASAVEYCCLLLGSMLMAWIGERRIFPSAKKLLQDFEVIDHMISYW